MDGRQSGYVFFFFFFVFALAVTVEASSKGYVSFSGTTVTLTCQDDSETDFMPNWYKSDQPANILYNGTSMAIENYDDKKEGMYECKYNSKSHYFYIKAKVCARCYDMDSILAFGIIFGDVLVTLGVVMLVYCFCKNTEAASAPQRAAKQRQVRGPARGPPVPDADYQPLNPATRSQDIYAQAHRQ